MIKFLILCLCVAATAFAANNPDHIARQEGKAVFVDFTKANYQIHYDIKNESVYAKSQITFVQEEAGSPIFDLVEKPLEVRINGKITKAINITSPDEVTSYKSITTQVPAGTHTLEVLNEINENIRFERGGVQSAFWMSDLSDRSYLEQYLPTNIEYDHYQMNFEITFTGNRTKQKVYTNGKVQKLKNKFIITYPDYFTASSIFFHTATEGRFDELKANFKSINGKSIPLTIYSRSSWNLQPAKRKALDVLQELEKKLGAWSHPSLVIYVAGQGGMEYCGATITSMSALGHEITHSYFARGVMPIDGNSGWMDEAIASWRDDGYKATDKPYFTSTSMAGHSQYRRKTDRRAYTQGANFMAYLNYTLANLGGLEKFLHFMHGKYVHTSINTEIFRKELEGFSGLNFEGDFKQYIYGLEKAQKENTAKNPAENKVANPFHPKLSKQDLLNLL